MEQQQVRGITEKIQASGIPMANSGDVSAAVDAIEPQVRYVLIAEASHGTSEFYRCRAQITRQLIEQKGFTAVICEADWPDMYRVNRFVRGADDDRDAVEALAGFERFPQWMWRNDQVVEFIDWLRAHNAQVPRGRQKCGMYGMDLYSLHGSIRAVLEYLDAHDHAAATRARYRYSCFEHFGEDPQGYGYAASFDMGRSCEDEVIRQLADLLEHQRDYVKRDGVAAQDEFFFAEQNARLVRNAEHYYRTMFSGRVSSWNIRDEHMAETVDALVAHLDKHNGAGQTKVVLRAHNSHLGDARATDMGAAGELNVGQLMRQGHGRECVNIGFTTHTGTVTAASNWDAPAERKVVRPSLPRSYERLMHDCGMPAFFLDMRNPSVRELLREERLERAIGVIYLPQTERLSHYFSASLSQQFDLLIHFDMTGALVPMERTAHWERGEAAREVPETFPTGV